MVRQLDKISDLNQLQVILIYPIHRIPRRPAQLETLPLAWLLPVFLNPTPTLIAFTGVTNAHGPSPQPTSSWSSSCNLMTATGNNQA